MKHSSRILTISRKVAVYTAGIIVGICFSIQCHAGFAFQGVNGAPVIFIPPVHPKPFSTFTVGSAQFLTDLVNACKPVATFCTIGWRIRNPGVPFFPVPNGIPLIKDNTVSSAPVSVPAGVWGIWDPIPTDIVPSHTIRVMELFTGLDLSSPSLGTIDLNDSFAQLQSVTGYPGFRLPISRPML